MSKIIHIGSRVFFMALFIVLTISIILVLVVAERHINFIEPLTFHQGTANSRIILQCNRFFTREIGLNFDPPIASEEFSVSSSGLRGTSHIKIAQRNSTIHDVEVKLENAPGGYYNRGLRKVALYRFPPTSYFCVDQIIDIKVDIKSSNIEQNVVELYVSEDKRK